MKYKKIMLILITAIFLVSIAGVSAADANDTAIASEDTTAIELSQSEEITTTDESQKTIQTNDTEMLTASDEETTAAQNNLDTLSLEEKTYADLSNAVGSGGNINLQPAYYKYNGESDTITITNPGIINGNGAIIDMAGSNIRAFDVDSLDVTIKNLTIKNANSNNQGGAIYFSYLGSVINCNFTGNTATYGGAIYFSDQGTVTNCNFTGNTATYEGGAVYVQYTGDVRNCNFTNDKAEDYGGAIRMNSGTVTNCNFTNNRAGSGGAVYFRSMGAVTNCNFTNNTATSQGGAIRFSSTGTVSNCNFTGNTATYGGAIYFSDQGTVTNCNFVDNKATGDFGRGGAIYFSDQGTVTNCNFVGNTANEDGGAVYFISTVEVTNCNFTGNTATFGGAIYFSDQGTVTNCNFTNNNAGDGGAVYFNNIGNVINCKFTGNKATISGCGGAIMFVSTGTASNCNFTNNTATSQGGAIRFSSIGTVSNCNFTNNTASGDGGAVWIYFGNVTYCNFTNNRAGSGGAIYISSRLYPVSATFCNFINNQATTKSGAMYGGTADTCIFKTGLDSTENTEILSPILNVDDFITVFDSGEKLTFDLKTNSGMPVDNGNVSISVYFKDNNSWVSNYSCLSGDGWIPDLPAGSYYAIFNTEYGGFNPINRTVTINKGNSTLTVNGMEFDYNTKGSSEISFTGADGVTAKVIGHEEAIVNVDSKIITVSGLDAGTYTLTVTTIPDENHIEVTKNAQIIVNKCKTELTADAINTTYNANEDLVITLKDNKGSPLSNQLLFVYLNGKKIFMTDPNGQVKISTKGLSADTYVAIIIFTGDDNLIKSNAATTVTISKDSTNLVAGAVTATYNVNKDLVITLKDSQGNPVKGADVTVDLNGVKTFTTNANGQVKISTGNLVPKTYAAKITFNGNDNYLKSTKDVKVTVTKATPKLTAKAKTFKKSVKTKKYSITLKDNRNKAISKAAVTIKIKGKTYKASTNAKGKAVFKIKKLTKKGKYKATIKFAGNNCYNKVTKKVKITIK